MAASLPSAYGKAPKVLCSLHRFPEGNGALQKAKPFATEVTERAKPFLWPRMVKQQGKALLFEREPSAERSSAERRDVVPKGKALWPTPRCSDFKEKGVALFFKIRTLGHWIDREGELGPVVYVGLGNVKECCPKGFAFGNQWSKWFSLFGKQNTAKELQIKENAPLLTLWDGNCPIINTITSKTKEFLAFTHLIFTFPSIINAFSRKSVTN